MDKAYIDAVDLLLRVAPKVFEKDMFAMKGGTAINLFMQDMPRLSIDIDVAYLPWKKPRQEALAEISQELQRIEARAGALGLNVRRIATKDLGELKLLVENRVSQIKVEVNAVFRGSVHPVEIRALAGKVSDAFGTELKLPLLSTAELYGSKLVAALDRQHPRDLFDAWQLMKSTGLDQDIMECFVIYLAGHNRPTHEVLFGNDKDISDVFHSNFVGMTADPVSLTTLIETRSLLRSELSRRLTENHKKFLIGLTRMTPDWSLLKCSHAAELPAL